MAELPRDDSRFGAGPWSDAALAYASGVARKLGPLPPATPCARCSPRDTPQCAGIIMYPHRIRLRGPWECRTEPGAAPRRMTMPCRADELPAPTVYLQRRFGYPGRLDD